MLCGTACYIYPEFEHEQRTGEVMMNCYLEPEAERPEDLGYIHEDDLPNIERLRDLMSGVMEAMYETGDVSMMESCLDEVCGELNLKINPNDPIIEKSGRPSLTSWYLGYHKATLDSLKFGRLK